MSSQFIQTARIGLSRIQPFLLWLLSTWFAYSMIVNGFRMLDPDGMWAKAFKVWGYPVWLRLLVGLLEIGGGILIVVPRARHIGGIILFAVMVGELATRLIFGTTLDEALSIASFAVFFLYLTSHYKPARATTDPA